MLRAIFVAAILPFLAAAQDEVASKDTQATFNARVNLVMVPVVVRDKQGRAVDNLKKEDFQLFDRGKPQYITRFTMERASDRIKPVEITSDDAEAFKSAETTAATATIPARFIAYVFDDLHIPFTDLVQAREAAKKYLVETLRPDERVAIYTTSARVMLDFTDDLGKIGEALLKITPQSKLNTHDCPPITHYQADLIMNKNDQTAFAVAMADARQCSQTDSTQAAQGQVRAAASFSLNMGDQDARTAFQVLKDIIRRMGGAPGERTVVMISSGFIVTDLNRRDEMEIMERAIKTNVTINSLDARGLYTGMQDASVSSFNQVSSPQRTLLVAGEAQALDDVMAELADGTGGTNFHHNNDLADGLRKTTRVPEIIYLLGFSPQNLKLDGSYHNLKVSLSTKGLTFVARRGYYAPKHQADEAELAKEEIREALFSREEMQDIPFQLQTQFFKADDQKVRLAVVTRIDLKPLHFRKDEGREKNSLIIVAGVFDRNGNLVTAIQKTVEMRLREETFEQRLNNGIVVKSSLDITPGSYVVRIVMRDQEGRMMTARNRVVEIPY